MRHFAFPVAASPRRAWLVPVLAVALTGCSLLRQDAVCTQADADSQVSVLWRPSDFGGPDAARIRLCVDGTCRVRMSGELSEPLLFLHMTLPDDIGASTLPVRLTVTSARTGETVVQDSVAAKLTAQDPNGASCPPRVWTATYRVDPVKGLTSPKGVKLQG
ncbi:hypothetical protein [Streptomyces sp. NPDC005017]|uniref:hypothetical protein n=1 Tax=Streptomyces sp. NPDC005017 TaxID=3364706 RepID=UPI00367C3584